MYVLEPLEAAAAAGNSIAYLTSGSISIGRPPKGPSTDIANVIVQGDASISKIHCTISLGVGLQQATQQATISDASRYGTCINDERLAPQEQRPLQAGDVIRLAAKSQYRLLVYSTVLSVTPGSAAEVLPLAAAAGLSLQEGWSPSTTHTLVEHGQQLWSAALLALLLNTPLVTGNWLRRLASRPAWPGSLPDAAADAPSTVRVGGSAGVQLTLDALKEQLRRNLLHSLVFCFAEDVQDTALQRCVQLMGGTTVSQTAGQPLQPTQLLVTSRTDTIDACVTPEDLLGCMASADISPLTNALHRTRAKLLTSQRPDMGGRPGAVSEDITEGDEQEEEVIEASQQGQAAAAEHEPHGPVLVSPVAVLAVSADGEGSASRPGSNDENLRNGWMTGGKRSRESPGVLQEHALPPQLEALQPFKRTRVQQHTVAAAAPGSIPASHPLAALPATAAVPAVTGTASIFTAPVSHEPSKGLASPLVRHHALGSTGCTEYAGQAIITADLTAQPANSTQHPQPADPAVGGPNFKAFRKRQPLASAPAAPIPLAVQDNVVKGPDTETFLREEQQKLERKRRADELFNVNLGPAGGRRR